MKTFWKAFTFAVMIMGVNAVADERSDYLKQYPAADTNGDGLVNILDLSFAARLLPEGTACH